MKNNKKIGVLAIALFTALGVFAQDSPFRFGVKAGANMSYATIENDGANAKVKAGYQIGATVDYSFARDWLIRSGLSFTTKGSKIDDIDAGYMLGGNGRGTTTTFNQLYLELPIQAAYKIQVSDSWDIVVGAGPYFAYGLGGKIKHKLTDGATYGDGTKEHKYNTFSDTEGIASDRQLKKFDFGLGVGVSVEYHNFVLGVGYELGLTNIADYWDYKYRNRNAMVTLGYKL